ncbi:hypothetical protein JXA47_02460 [Candidatus Sumerlaeota bacterium]|nr:hypothetical protein [Candidatus Sumerlaeota bacterium]
MNASRVLFLGRDERAASTIGLQLTTQGIRVQATASLRMASTQLMRGGIDLLLVDTGLSVIPARAFLEKAREFVPQVPRALLVLEGEEPPCPLDIQRGGAVVLRLPAQDGWLDTLLSRGP